MSSLDGSVDSARNCPWRAESRYTPRRPSTVASRASARTLPSFPMTIDRAYLAQVSRRPYGKSVRDCPQLCEKSFGDSGAKRGTSNPFSRHAKFTTRLASLLSPLGNTRGRASFDDCGQDEAGNSSQTSPPILHRRRIFAAPILRVTDRQTAFGHGWQPQDTAVQLKT